MSTLYFSLRLSNLVSPGNFTPHGLSEAFVWLEGQRRDGSWCNWHSTNCLSNFSSYLSAECNGGNMHAENNNCLNMHWQGWCSNFQPDKWKCKTCQMCYDNFFAHQRQGNSALPKEILASLYHSGGVFTICWCIEGVCVYPLSIRLPEIPSGQEIVSVFQTPTQSLVHGMCSINWFQSHLLKSNTQSTLSTRRKYLIFVVILFKYYMCKPQAIHCLIEDMQFSLWGCRQLSTSNNGDISSSKQIVGPN